MHSDQRFSVGESHSALTTRILSLDGLRAFSVLMVISSHLLGSRAAPSWLTPVLSFADGTLGVRIFFCISGFLITYLMLREIEKFNALNIQAFFARRILRIVPVCYAYIAVVVVLPLFLPITLSACEISTAMTFTKNYACREWILLHLWSVSVEEQFYLIWPFIVAHLRPRQIALLAIAAIVVSPVSRAVEYSVGYRGFFWLTSNTDALMFGSLAAMMVVYRMQAVVSILARWPHVLRLLAFALMFVPVWLSRHLLMGWFTVTIGPTVQALCATYIIVSYAFYHHGRFFMILNAWPVVIIGYASYSLYIWQQMFLSVPEVYGLQKFFILDWPLNVLLVFGVGTASFLLIEKPLARLRHSFRPNAILESKISGQH